MAISSFAASPAPLLTRQVWRFGLLCSVFALLWFVGSAYGLGDDTALDLALCHQLAAASAWGLRLAGWAAATDALQPSLLLLGGQPSVIVGGPCDGLVLYVLLAGFVLAYPGPARRRLWFIPLGIAGLWLLNIIRIIVLALNHQYSPATFDFDHHYAFNAVAYTALAGLWLLWTRQSEPLVAAPPATPAASATAAPSAQPWLTVRLASGLLLLLALVLNSAFRTELLAVMSAGWTAALASGPAWLQRLPGAGAGDVPAGVSRLALPVGLAYLGLFLVNALLALCLLRFLPSSRWRTAPALGRVARRGLGRRRLFCNSS
ncbi:MAG: exosortase/archaeosortase family protein [Hymenobacter sp.]|nr:MAG: exosortase/archaeosortase family protein [Hymenobacter sp.]